MGGNRWLGIVACARWNAREASVERGNPPPHPAASSRHLVPPYCRFILAVSSHHFRLMGCDDLSPLLLQRTMKVPGAVYNIQLTPPQAQAARNAFSMAVYALLFDWLVAKVRRANLVVVI